MKRIVLLRFHKDLEVVQNRIDLLKFFNPEIKIYGLFGGEKNEFFTFKNTLVGLEDIHFLDIAEKDIKWRFSDYCILQWYLAVGKLLDFDMVHALEYDIVLLDTLERLYPFAEGEKHIYLTCLIELEKIKPNWNWFNNSDFPSQESSELERLFKEKYGLNNLFGSMAPGTTLTKDYLEGYSQLDLPLIGHDELRMPAIAQILGIEMRDTGFVRDWFDESGRDFRLFNCDNHAVDREELLKAYQENYLKAFHPVYFSLDPQELRREK